MGPQIVSQNIKRRHFKPRHFGHVCCFVTIINLANHFTTTFILCTFVKLTREKNTKTKNKNLILKLFIFTVDFSCNKRVSQSFFFLLQNWTIVTKLMECTDYFPSCQLYHYTKTFKLRTCMHSEN